MSVSAVVFGCVTASNLRTHSLNFGCCVDRHEVSSKSRAPRERQDPQQQKECGFRKGRLFKSVERKI